ncbi:MAG: type II toxin-antitoxin system Phd/YefM family antitoxin [Acidimicrobiia bacterium]|nr:type II toxin-antitoxin system Phd/YefM family antitoxin [Acidimicrobiia bacterium]
MAARNPSHISISAFNERGVSSIVRQAEAGEDVIVERHGRAVAAVVSTARLEASDAMRHDLESAALVLARAAADSGNRTDLDDVLASFSLTREDLLSDG